MSVEVQATPSRREPRPGRPRTRGRAPVPTPPRRKIGEALGIVVLLGLLGVVLPVAVASHYGAIGIPRSDDWSYLLTLFHWVESGKLQFNGWVSMTLIGQIVIAAPVAAMSGRSITTIQMYTALIGLVGLLGVVFIGRQVVRPRWWAVFVAATIAVGPLWGPLAPTFMTDVPTFTFEMLTLAAAGMAFRKRPLSLPWFATSIVLGFVGVSIRQYAVVPVIAVVIVAICVLVVARDWRRLRIVLVISAIFGVAALGVVAWWTGLPDSKSLSPTLPGAHSISLMVTKDAGFLRLAGLMILPMVALAGPVRIVKRAWGASNNLTTLLATATVLWLAGTYEHLSSIPFVGNYFARDGVLSIMVLGGNRPDVIPTWAYDTLVLLGSLSGVVLVLAVVPYLADVPRRARERTLHEVENPLAAVMGLTVAGFGAAYSLAILTGLPVYDRYALPFLPLVAFLVLRTTRHESSATRAARPRVVWAGAAIALLAIVGLCYTVDSASFDGTRWKVAELATEKGYQPLQVDGGFEWLGYHLEHAFRFKDFQTVHQKIPFARPCVTIVINPSHPERPKVAAATSTAISRGPATIVAQRNQLPCLAEKQGQTAPAEPGADPAAPDGTPGG